MTCPVNRKPEGDRAYYAKGLSAERLAKVYELADARVRQYLEAEIDHLKELAGPNDAILELGCGYGRVVSELDDGAVKLHGIDNSEANVEMGRKLYPGIDFRVMDAANLDYADESFDLVFGVQNFISACKINPEVLLKEALRVTRPGGTVLFTSYAAEFWPHRLRWFEAQAEHGLLGEIDHDLTGDGVIVCKDGFRATTFSLGDFQSLFNALKMGGKIYTLDQSSTTYLVKRN